VLIAIGAISALVLLVLASDAFTNAVEWVGALYGLARGAIGTVIAAVGSSLPETAIAFVALVVLRDRASQAVGIGAVLGAPFMLATAVFAVIGIIALARTRDSSGDCNVRVGIRSTRFGLGLFAFTFALVIGASFAPTSIVRPVVAVLIVIAYVVFVTYSMRDKSTATHEEPPPPPLRFAPRMRRPAPVFVFAQLALSLCLTVFASHWFVTSLAAASTAFGIAPLVLSLFLSPIATELPELLNVVIWMRRGLDDYAVGNVIGAMMFQTSIASAIALLATPWVIDRFAYAAAIATFAAVTLVLLVSQMRDHLNSWALTACGALYVVYLWYAIATH
jgi:cation:H+ antiporter